MWLWLRLRLLEAAAATAAEAVWLWLPLWWWHATRGDTLEAAAVIFAPVDGLDKARSTATAEAVIGPLNYALRPLTPAILTRYGPREHLASTIKPLSSVSER